MPYLLLLTLAGITSLWVFTAMVVDPTPATVLCLIWLVTMMMMRRPMRRQTRKTTAATLAIWLATRAATMTTTRAAAPMLLSLSVLLLSLAPRVAAHLLRCLAVATTMLHTTQLGLLAALQLVTPPAAMRRQMRSHSELRRLHRPQPLEVACHLPSVGVASADGQPLSGLCSRFGGEWRPTLSGRGTQRYSTRAWGYWSRAKGSWVHLTFVPS
jgi:hypothetical protein